MRRFAFNFSQNGMKRLAAAVTSTVSVGAAYGVAGMATASSDFVPTINDTETQSAGVKTQRARALPVQTDARASTASTPTTLSSTSISTPSSSSSYGDLYESAQLYSEPLPLDTNFFESEWEDWYQNKIDLIFTEPQFGVDSSGSLTDPNNDDIKCRMERLVRATQEHFCHEMVQLEKSARAELGVVDGDDDNFEGFVTDFWKRPQERCGVGSKHAGGLTKVLSQGKVFEKAGVSVSISSGKLPKGAVAKMTANHAELQKLLASNSLGDSDGNVEYFAASVSSVVHPWNPHSPTGHFNYRYFELGDKKIVKIADTQEDKEVFVPKLWWFGGGGDLTPSVLYEEDCKYFHGVFKQIIDKYDGTGKLHQKFKKWCDDYFVIKHRDHERRGIGGIFFDDLVCVDENDTQLDEEARREKLFGFIKDLASAWAQGYLPIVKRHAMQNYTNEEKEWQQIRRGRYVEFNLVYDRGTKFGLMKPGARYESILMSLPLTANWQYCRGPKHDFEKKMYDVIINPVDWI